MNSLWPSRAANEGADAATPTEDIAETQISKTDLDTTKRATPDLPSRPGLLRNQSRPEPPAPRELIAAPACDLPAPTDSLSLIQLRKIVAEFGRTEPVAYDFVYADTGPHDEEIDEWFVYQFWQWMRLNAAQRAFEWQWQHEYQMQSGWDESDLDTRIRFVKQALNGVRAVEQSHRASSAGKLVYLVLGRWGDTSVPVSTGGKRRSAASPSQLAAIRSGVEFLTSVDGFEIIWEALRNCFENFSSGDPYPTQPSNVQETQDELMNLMTIMYIAIQQVLDDPVGLQPTKEKLLCLEPGLVDFMSTATAKLRWDEGGLLPASQVFLLFWKSILLVFGGSKEIDEVKRATSETGNDQKPKDIITASPLDYHVFRQEVTSKYPAYVPPRPPIPLEAENTTLLPPLPNQPPKNNAANGILPGPPNNQSGGASILHQPVHIATPAPSPPPSPGIGGKGGKKQNYQTNQNFPFMYPPLDATSNGAGGKGGAGLQDSLVGRKWEGSDIPASILEAGELFSRRVRMTRATRQLWDERERFLKFERGWDSEVSDSDIEDLDLDELSLEEKEEIAAFKAERRGARSGPPDDEIDFGPNTDISKDAKRRLMAVEKFYKDSLPHLQSLIIVLLRPILMNVTAIMTQSGANQQHPSMAGRGAAGMNGGPGPNRQQDSSAGGNAGPEQSEMSPEEVDAARSREITTKAITGILLLLLKWLKVSHVLKFEYMTQLLLDSNYLPLVLKLFAHQDIQQVVDSNTDRTENSFFHFCNLRSRSKEKAEVPESVEGMDGGNEQDEEVDESEDEAAPPPIKRRRSPPRSSEAPEKEEGVSNQLEAQARPEVDELGYPVNPLPMEPITDFSRRNFFSLINYLRIMQKICKHKAHRNLLMVQYKSSNILRKSLKVPQPELRLYTLKLFKNQVPYCGRKWRQSNMRVITAVYLYCRPELRDEWLAGSDVDAEVDASLPLEQALRSLTHWFNVRRYPEKIAPELRTALREEQDFFTRELEKFDLNWTDMGGDEGSNMSLQGY